jgi:hypothetical protein
LSDRLKGTGRVEGVNFPAHNRKTKVSVLNAGEMQRKGGLREGKRGKGADKGLREGKGEKEREGRGSRWKYSEKLGNAGERARTGPGHTARGSEE